MFAFNLWLGIQIPHPQRKIQDISKKKKRRRIGNSEGECAGID